MGQAVLIGEPGPIDAALGALFALTLLWLVARGFRGYRGADGLGLGDLKFAAAAGLWIGWEGVAPMLLIASASALAFVAFRSWTQRRFDLATRLAFGPFLGLGTAACWLTVVQQS
nr:A24 family peptidase [Bradyrhizobium diazoefficiens]